MEEPRKVFFGGGGGGVALKLLPNIKRAPRKGLIYKQHCLLQVEAYLATIYVVYELQMGYWT